MEKVNQKLKSLEQTCFACPSQWEGELENGKFIYIRFRWGNLGYGIGDTIGEAIHNYDYGESISDGLDGLISEEEMLKHLGLSL